MPGNRVFSWRARKVPSVRIPILLCAALLLIAPVLADMFELTDRVLASINKKHGPAASERVAHWKRLMETNRGLSEKEKLVLVNDFFNQVPFVSDLDHWGKEDYWATPLEMLATFGADCEDFSIAKYFTLVQIGVPVQKLQITYVKATTWNPVSQAHMVLVYYPTPEAIPLVLDNLIPEIMPASARKDLIPVYSFNGEGLWFAKERGTGKSAGRSDRIKLWRDLNERMGREADVR